MGLIDKSATRKEFIKFKEETNKKLTLLEKGIDSKITYDEKWIKNTAGRVKTYYENIKGYENDIQDKVSQINDYSRNSKNILEEVNILKNNLNDSVNKVDEHQILILRKESEINESSTEVDEKIEIINKAFKTVKNFPEELRNIEDLLEESKNLNENIKTLKDHSANKTSEIEALYNDINGQDIRNNSEEIVHTDGIKDKLKKTYDDLSHKVDELNVLLDKSIEKSTTKFNNLLEDSKNSYKETNDKLKTLLPGAMASGLSSAYEKKIADEKKSQKLLDKNFKHSLIGLVLVSLIPVCVDIYRLVFLNNDLLAVIKDTPSLIISIFPIYFPILWFAHSSSKKLNLSKRLIEEYTHKAVLGNTFEGLSTQIENLSTDNNIRDELRVKLLFNLLQVSSENPGKLITNYQTSDHPLMEALENSSKLSSSINKLNNIPGFSAIAKKLSIKQNKIINEEDEKIKNGFAKQDELEQNR
jgi:hypothetical protein